VTLGYDKVSSCHSSFAFEIMVVKYRHKPSVKVMAASIESSGIASGLLSA